MATWKESVSRLAQSAVTKSKEVAESARLNVEIGAAEQKLREAYTQLGEYLANHEELLPQGDETVQGLRDSMAEIREKIERARQQLQELKTANICPVCGAEVSPTDNFCLKCGAPLDRPGREKRVCPKCGAEMTEGALFCENCGTKLEQAQEDQDQTQAETETAADADAEGGGEA